MIRHNRGRPLPEGYQTILQEAIAALAQAERDLYGPGTGSATPEKLLALRAVRGLRGRLGEMEPDDWQAGRVLTTLAPLDVGAQEHCESVYDREPMRSAIGRLRLFLRDYLEL